METFVWLANASAEVESGGFGLNFDIFEANLINLSIIIGVLVYFGKGFLGKTLSERSERIETAIKEAEQRVQAAKEGLSDSQQKLTQAQAEAQRIRANAEEQAEVAKAAILAKSDREIERMKATASQELEGDRDKAIAELRNRVTAQALELAEAQLRDRLNDRSTQEQAVERGIALLGGNG
ncbi:MAG: F0F1 ATP synthase subunit B [Geitlerinemataceae cyanobacterium]